MNADGIFKNEFIIDIYNHHEEEEKKIIQYEKYMDTFFVFTEDEPKNLLECISPFFDENLRIKGYGYIIQINPFKDNNGADFSDYTINNYLIKIIYLLAYFKDYENYLKEDIFKKYYLINENWINKFKEKCYYEKTKESIKNNKNANKIFEVMSLNDTNLLIKQIFFLIKYIPEINKFYNDSQINLSNEQFPNEEPDFKGFFLSQEENITFYNNFYLIEKSTFDQVYDIKEEHSKNMESKNYYSECFYIEGYTFVKLKNELITGSNKIVIEVGHSDNTTYKFNLEYILVYDDNENYISSFEYLKKYKFSTYFSHLNFHSKAVISLKINSIKYGYIYKYNNEFKKENGYQSLNQIEINKEENPTIHIHTKKKEEVIEANNKPTTIKPTDVPT